MLKQDGTIEPRAECAGLFAQPSNVVKFPSPRRFQQNDGLSLLLEAKNDLIQIQQDLALLDAVLAELRDLALSATTMENLRPAFAEASVESR